MLRAEQASLPATLGHLQGRQGAPARTRPTFPASNLQPTHTTRPQVVDAHTLRPVADVAGRQVLIAVAAFYGKVRLIDNVDFAA